MSVRTHVCMYACNVSSWLVARFAILANVLQIIRKLMYCLESSLLWQKNGRAFFLEKKQPVIAEKQTFFSKTLKLSQVFAQLSIWACKCISIWVGLFAGLTIAASCARAAPGSPEGKQAFSKSNCQIQTPSLSQRSQSLIKPLLNALLKSSFSTIFQGPGPGEAPFHFNRFVCWAHYCSKLCQSSSWKPRREASLFQKQLPNSNSKPFPKEPTPY